MRYLDWTAALWIVLMSALFVLAPLGCAGGSGGALMAELQAKSLYTYVIVLAACLVSAAMRGVRGISGKDDA